MNIQSKFEIRPARVEDVPVILGLIRELATYERAPDEVTATEEQLVDVLFGEKPVAEVLLAFEGRSPVGFAVFFHNFSTWLGRPGLYLEDLFVKPDKRGKGYGRALLVDLAKVARDRSILLRLPAIAVAGGWNGRCSIGTNLRLNFIAVLARNQWRNGPCFD